MIYLSALEELLPRRGSLSREIAFCAIKIISVIDRWMQFRRKRYADDWVFMPIIRQGDKDRFYSDGTHTSFYLELLGEHGKDAIRSALKWLSELGIIEVRKNPHNGQDRTLQYRISEVGRTLLKVGTTTNITTGINTDLPTTDRRSVSSTSVENVSEVGQGEVAVDADVRQVTAEMPSEEAKPVGEAAIEEKARAVESAGFKLNQALSAAMAFAPLAEIQAAAAAAAEYVKAQASELRRAPEAVLLAAIRGRWKVRGKPERPREHFDPGHALDAAKFAIARSDWEFARGKIALLREHGFEDIALELEAKIGQLPAAKR